MRKGSFSANKNRELDFVLPSKLPPLKKPLESPIVINDIQSYRKYEYLGHIDINLQRESLTARIQQIYGINPFPEKKGRLSPELKKIKTRNATPEKIRQQQVGTPVVKHRAGRGGSVGNSADLQEIQKSVRGRRFQTPANSRQIDPNLLIDGISPINQSSDNTTTRKGKMKSQDFRVKKNEPAPLQPLTSRQLYEVFDRFKERVKRQTGDEMLIVQDLLKKSM